MVSLVNRSLTLLSNCKWVAMSARPLFSDVSNWATVILHALVPSHQGGREVRFRSGSVLEVNSDYPFQAIAEACLLDVYYSAEFNGCVAVDVGAGVGDFVMMALRAGATRVIAFEPDPNRVLLLNRNISRNNLSGAVTVVPSNFSPEHLDALVASLPGGTTLKLKMDCEGCEFESITKTRLDTLSRVSGIHMELHAAPTSHLAQGLVAHLRQAKFHVVLRAVGSCQYLHAYKPQP